METKIDGMGAFDTEYDKLNMLNNISNLSMKVE